MTRKTGPFHLHIPNIPCQRLRVRATLIFRVNRHVTNIGIFSTLANPAPPWTYLIIRTTKLRDGSYTVSRATDVNRYRIRFEFNNRENFVRNRVR